MQRRDGDAGIVQAPDRHPAADARVDEGDGAKAGDRALTADGAAAGERAAEADALGHIEHADVDTAAAHVRLTGKAGGVSAEHQRGEIVESEGSPGGAAQRAVESRRAPRVEAAVEGRPGGDGDIGVGRYRARRRSLERTARDGNAAEEPRVVGERERAAAALGDHDGALQTAVETAVEAQGAAVADVHGVGVRSERGREAPAVERRRTARGAGEVTVDGDILAGDAVVAGGEAHVLESEVGDVVAGTVVDARREHDAVAVGGSDTLLPVAGGAPVVVATSAGPGVRVARGGVAQLDRAVDVVDGEELGTIRERIERGGVDDEIGGVEAADRAGEGGDRPGVGLARIEVREARKRDQLDRERSTGGGRDRQAGAFDAVPARARARRAGGGVHLHFKGAAAVPGLVRGGQGPHAGALGHRAVHGKRPVHVARATEDRAQGDGRLAVVRRVAVRALHEQAAGGDRRVARVRVRAGERERAGAGLGQAERGIGAVR